MATKWLKVKWVATNPGGGSSIVGFKELKEEFIERPDGGTEYVRDKEPKVVTILPKRATVDKNVPPVEKGDQLFHLKKGEFIVQDLDDNMELLKEMISKGWVRMTDWDLHEQLSGEDSPDQIVEKIVEEETIKVDITPKDSTAAKNKKKNKKKNEMAAKMKARASSGN